MIFWYSVLIRAYHAAIAVAAAFNPKAKKWIAGRNDWRATLAGRIREYPTISNHPVWMHCASLGEFEQGRPVLEALRQAHPATQIVVTFFSPSGFEVRRDWPGADLICYLPMDGKRNASDFIELINPSLAIFVKYEFWYHYLATLSSKKIPVILISAAFREGQPFFKWWGGLWRKMLGFYDAVFVQDAASARRIEGLAKEIVVAGDTRCDRVLRIAKAAEAFPVITQFKRDSKLLIAGSTWLADEIILAELLAVFPPHWKLVIAPHELDDSHLAEIDRVFGADLARYSTFSEKDASEKVLVIDNIGMLASLYRYAEIAWIGGGYHKSGIHNTLEAAVFGLPVLMGPEYQKFIEARMLVERGFAFPVSNWREANAVMTRLSADEPRGKLRGNIREYIASQAGATQSILNWLAQRSTP